MEEARNSTATERFYAFLNQCIPWLIGIFLFFNPFPHTTAVKEISFYLSLLFFLVLLFARKRGFSFRTPLSIPFALFVIWSCIGLFFALNKPNSFHDIYAHLLKHLFVFYIVVNFFSSEKRFQAILWVFIISTGILIFILLIHEYAILHRPLRELFGLYFPEIAPNIIALLTLFSMLLSISLIRDVNPTYRNIVLIASVCLSAFATAATQARSAILAMIGAIAVIFPRRKKILLWFCVITVALAAAFMPIKDRFTLDAMRQKMKDDHRLSIWLCYAEIIKDHPIVGVGFGMQTCYDDKMLMKYNQRVPEQYRMTHLYNAPHNLLVDTATRTGLVGLALFLYILFSFVKMGWHLIRRGRNEFIRDWSLCIMGTFVAVFIQGMFENTLSGPPAVILYSIFAMMTILWRMQHEPSGAPRTGAPAPDAPGKANP
ncbi:MAG TPA: O-antigen ligase family protein [Syntrophales bacterium]|nr:O-antigen ligase family protein [Syntrophales bacterium]